MSNKKKIAITISILLVLSIFAMIVSASPLLKNSKLVSISENEAEDIALERVGLSRESVRFERTEIDRERGKLIWEVEFRNENTEYSFEIDAESGKIVREEIEPERNPSPAKTTQPPVTEPPVIEAPTTNPPAVEITREKAIEIALSDAGLTRSNKVRDLEAKKDYERGTLVYEVDFEHEKNEYSYDIRVSDGKILHHDIEIDD